MVRIDKAFPNFAKQHLRWASGGTVTAGKIFNCGTAKSLRIATTKGFQAVCRKIIGPFNCGTAREIWAREALIKTTMIQNPQNHCFAITSVAGSTRAVQALSGHEMFDKDYVSLTGDRKITENMATTGYLRGLTNKPKALYGWLMRFLWKI